MAAYILMGFLFTNNTNTALPMFGFGGVSISGCIWTAIKQCCSCITPDFCGCHSSAAKSQCTCIIFALFCFSLEESHGGAPSVVTTNGTEGVKRFESRIGESLNVSIIRIPCASPAPDCHPADCAEIYNNGYRTNGVYQIYPAGSYVPVNVYCDLTTDGGNWTVFQRRKDGFVNFRRNWTDYKNGFGFANTEYWLGLENMFLLSNKKTHQLRIDMEDFAGAKAYAKYAKFYISPYALNGEEDGYSLYISGFTDGGAGDSLSYHYGQKFSTYDRDQDAANNGNCASLYHGGYWYGACHTSNPNGLYLRGSTSLLGQGIVWSSYKGQLYSLKSFEMKMRPA
ncbi:microfibril-associated glycoprotein 4-like [Protopterus annectens]|uniref:microfibril-associated glycoprotein 4-like n=1 Tax=Protopterus annectens TaxID=7888 RepID=UPI001CFB42B5|nr:microfibril-associated glycoprotein 4-like [Protopterus annectens]